MRTSMNLNVLSWSGRLFKLLVAGNIQSVWINKVIYILGDTVKMVN